MVESSAKDILALRGLNILFRVLTFAKPECDNVLQPEPQSTPGLNGNEALYCCVLKRMKPAASDLSMTSYIVTR